MTKVTTSFSGETLNAVFSGDILSTNAERLRTEMLGLLSAEQAPERPWKTLCLDLQRAILVDSMGLNLLVSLIKEVHKQGRAAAILLSSPSLVRIFRFTRLDQMAELRIASPE